MIFFSLAGKYIQSTDTNIFFFSKKSVFFRELRTVSKFNFQLNVKVPTYECLCICI